MFTLILLVLVLRLFSPWRRYRRWGMFWGMPGMFWGMPGMWRRPPMHGPGFGPMGRHGAGRWF